ncbi:unnamed protein product [Effrenium voratum]|uniref:Protein kinase domain-containing protein n=1 Tax=Effrenium voratum TaxID=2562239 RepID=A0AA36IXE3_9DINO|nr:unnamed protein product [Effrenium voratum]CAJ1413646.1 unnamed protein product [Effrenium voratum]
MTHTLPLQKVPLRSDSTRASLSISRPNTPGEIRRVSRPGSSSVRGSGSARGGASGASLSFLPPEPPRSISPNWQAEAVFPGQVPSASSPRPSASPPPPPPPPAEEREDQTLDHFPSRGEAGLHVTIGRREFGDGNDLSDEEPPAPAWNAASCTRGLKGVTSLSMSDSMLSAALEQSQLLGTMSSPSAVRGSMTWVRGENLGRGSLGNVFQALDQGSGQLFAVKEVLINTSDAADVQFKDALENEIEICSRLKHPSIVTYLGHDYIDKCLFIYMEYMIGGSMASVLQQFGAFEESLTARYTRDLLEGLAYLHTQDPPVLHRDIKSANILMGHSANSAELCAKLADFGCSKRTENSLSHTLKGSIPWMAPEVVKNVGYGRMADMWSFGCVVLEMGTAQSPWGKFDNPMAAMYKIGMSEETPPIPEDFSDLSRSFVKRCLQRDPAERATATELLQHPFVQNLELSDD